ncbi:MAG: bifunctional hydroxymethylpyrimidine kinase/phosphomethylpyrimidine kinase [Lachnospiraceae bacterium]|nr:bifunctional hydroxymethylpyrimidine kinase/phosphomethylpyrimidine kinase [Lachnospiraceae bacterium]
MTQHNHNLQKKVAVFNDFTGFGRCALTVQLPLISALGLQCCPVPTVLFSNHTAFPSHFRMETEQNLAAYLAEWEKLDLKFEGIAVGYFTSETGIDAAHAFLETQQQALIVVDPIMGDHGRMYASCTPARAEKLKSLLPLCDLLTPNLTEACILTDTPYTPNPDEDLLRGLCEKLVLLSAPAESRRPDPESPCRLSKILITGIECGDQIGNYVYETTSGKASGTEAGKKPGGKLVCFPRVGISRAGTGDVMAAILTGDLVNGVSLTDALEHAQQFLSVCLETAIDLGLPPEDGIPFELHLKKL